MEKTLIEAAKKGDITTLQTVTKNDPLYHLRAATLSCLQSPLHIACIGGHVDFVKEVLSLNPELATELSQDGLSALHIASANGDLEIVKELLKVGNPFNVCLVKGKERRIPLHYAVVKGQIPVVRELLANPGCKDSVTEVTARGETCFHLAVKNNRFEAFKVLVEHVVSINKEDVLNNADGQGNTVLHLAASAKEYEFVDILLDKKFGYKGNLEINKLNKLGLTPLDLLILQGGDPDIQEMLTLSGAIGVEQMHESSQQTSVVHSPSQSGQSQRLDQPKSAYKRLQQYFKYDRISDSPSKVRNMLLVISVLIATATYQAVLSPPGGVWQDDSNQTPHPHKAGQSVMGTNAPVSFGLFLLSNSIGFFMALHMMNFLTIGLPLQFELRVALVALTSTYDTCMIAMTSNGLINVFFITLSIVTPFAVGLSSWLVRDYMKGHWCVRIAEIFSKAVRCCRKGQRGVSPYPTTSGSV